MPAQGGLHSPEQRSFRERQKYFEVEVKQQQVDKPPKRVSLVGEDDLKKMKEEEGRLHSVKGSLAWEVKPSSVGGTGNPTPAKACRRLIRVIESLR